MPRTVTTEATGRQEATPELARVDVEVVDGGPTAAAARAAAADRATTLETALTDVVDADDVRRTGQSVQRPDDMFEPATDAAHEATEQFTVACVAATAGDVVVRATDAGATVRSVTFQLHDAEQRQLGDAALEQATHRAREKAERIAAAEGQSVGAVRELSTTDPSTGMQSLFDDALMEGNTDFQPEPISVKGTVEAVYELE